MNLSNLHSFTFYSFKVNRGLFNHLKLFVFIIGTRCKWKLERAYCKVRNLKKKLLTVLFWPRSLRDGFRVYSKIKNCVVFFNKKSFDDRYEYNCNGMWKCEQGTVVYSSLLCMAGHVGVELGCTHTFAIKRFYGIWRNESQMYSNFLHEKRIHHVQMNRLRHSLLIYWVPLLRAQRKFQLIYFRKNGLLLESFHFSVTIS